jgi:hypothetical protein
MRALQESRVHRFASGACQCRSAHEHPHVTGKRALAWRGEDLLLVVARLEKFHFAAQNNDEGNVPLACFKDQFVKGVAPHFAWGYSHLDSRERGV